MDAETKRAVTEALDSAIAKVAREEFARLSASVNHDNDEIARRVDRAVTSLADSLGQGNMPDYSDEWVALFYAVWYQPAHINLAYTLVRSIRKESNPLLTGEGSLRVFDFGCGAFAMEFGLLIARLESAIDHDVWVRLDVHSRDKSEAMVSIGKEILAAFRGDFFDKFSQESIPEFRTKRSSRGPARRWVTALHVAYAENARSVKKDLDEIIQKENPDFVLVTTHKGNSKALYDPAHLDYGLDRETRNVEGELHEIRMKLLGEVTEFRNGLTDLPGLSTKSLLKTHTTWNNKISESVNRFYLRRGQR